MDDDVKVDEEIDGGVEATVEVRVDNRIVKRRCLIFLLIVFVIGGFLAGLLPEESEYQGALEFATTLLGAFVVLAWCHFDAEEYNYVISRGLSICLVLLQVIAFPYYIFMSRRGMACLKAFGLAGLFVALLVIAYAIGFLPGGLISEVMSFW